MARHGELRPPNNMVNFMMKNGDVIMKKCDLIMKQCDFIMQNGDFIIKHCDFSGFISEHT